VSDPETDKLLTYLRVLIRAGAVNLRRDYVMGAVWKNPK
jgi:hypothetical protein